MGKHSDDISLEPVDLRGPGFPEFVDFMTNNTFPFHVRIQPSREQIIEALNSGRFDDDDHLTFWVGHRLYGKIGVMILEDLGDNAPLFDFRLDERFRGLGFGTPALRLLASYVFETFPEVNRFEGQTREDNIAMRKTFLRAGFLKEAHYSEGWPVDNGKPLASVAYAILRSDWLSGEATQFVWEDLRA
ncbi:MAG: GNAT family protein [Microbacteriaceae bacterium]